MTADGTKLSSAELDVALKNFRVSFGLIGINTSVETILNDPNHPIAKMLPKVGEECKG